MSRKEVNMGSVLIWGWCADPAGWVKILVNSDGKLIIDPEVTAALEADVGDASASTLGSLYGILGNPAQSFLAMIGYQGATSLANKLTAARAVLLDNLDNSIADLITRTKGLDEIYDAIAGAGMGIFPSASIEKIDDITDELAPVVSGDMSVPSYLIDNNTATDTFANAVGKYTELTFKTPVILTGWRQYGNTANAGNGVWKIEYYDGSAWQDWKTGIATRTSNDWSTWDAPGIALVKGKKVRLTCTTRDTNNSHIKELELHGLCAYSP